MGLIKNDVIADDSWQHVADDAPVPAGDAIVGLQRFIAERDALLARDGRLGVRLTAADQPDAVAGDLDKLALVAVEFPKYVDGRGYSIARLLRDRYGFKGELRAIGDVLCEQLTFMLRSGFDSFEMQSATALEEFNSVVREVRVVYQATADGRPTAIDQRMAAK